MALWAGFITFLMSIDGANLAVIIACGIGAAIMLLAHILLPYSKTAWTISEWGWAIAACGGLVVSISTKGLYSVAFIPVFIWGSMRLYRKTALARLSGEPPISWSLKSEVPTPGPCRICGDTHATIIAPRYCVSVVFASFSFPGSFRNLCRRHAILFALPATIFTALAGWWGFPWGFIWTPQVIIQNLTHGGLGMDAAEAEAIRQQEFLEGGRRDLAGALACAMGLVFFPALMIYSAMPYLENSLRLIL